MVGGLERFYDTLTEQQFIFVWRRVEEQDSQDVDVPQAVDTGEEAAGVVKAGQVLVVEVPVVYLVDLGHHEEDDRHDGTEDGEDHEETESVEKTLQGEKKKRRKVKQRKKTQTIPFS